VRLAQEWSHRKEWGDLKGGITSGRVRGREKVRGKEKKKKERGRYR